MKRPYVRCKYEPEMDKPINSFLLMQIFRIMKVKYVHEEDAFTNGCSWKVEIRDQHDHNEPSPHYILEVGEGDVSDIECKTFDTRYCDYYSCGYVEQKSVIETNPGKWSISIWVPQKFFMYSHDDIEDLAIEIDGAYKEAMNKALPDYFIASSRIPRDEE